MDVIKGSPFTHQRWDESPWKYIDKRLLSLSLSLSLIRESQKATDATENVDEMTQLDCAILHAVCQCERRRRMGTTMMRMRWGASDGRDAWRMGRQWATRSILWHFALLASQSQCVCLSCPI